MPAESIPESEYQSFHVEIYSAETGYHMFEVKSANYLSVLDAVADYWIEHDELPDVEEVRHLKIEFTEDQP